MFPHVHDEERVESGRMTVLVQGDPMVAEPSRLRVLVEDGPAHASHAGNIDEVALLGLEGPEVSGELQVERRVFRPVRGLRREIVEVELV